MKKRSLSIAILLTFVVLSSCDEYKTRVSNKVHNDGSVTRTVVMFKDNNKEFSPDKYLVPIDSTWDIQYAVELKEDGDTIKWILTAEKLFDNVDQINSEYEADSGQNKGMTRYAEFSKKYRWFYTEYRYAETVESILDVECAPDSFLNPEELKHFFLPVSIADNLKNGSDSIKFRELSKEIETKTEAWFWTGLVKQWILNLHTLASENENYSLTLAELQSKEDQFLYNLEKYGDKDDFLPDSIVKYVMGIEFLDEFKMEVDSATKMFEVKFEEFLEATHYELEICMPGKLTESNGFIATNEELTDNRSLLWSVSGEYFFAQDYVMWAESREKNLYAWIISAIFVLFTALGLLLRKRKS
jgi:hypothetical protein